MQLTWCDSDLHLVRVNGPTSNAGSAVVEIEDLGGKLVAGVLCRAYRMDDPEFTFALVDSSGNAVLRMVRPAGLDSGRRLWTISEAAGRPRARVAVRIRTMGEQLHVQSTSLGSATPGSVLCEVHARRLIKAWQLTTPAGEKLAVEPVVGATAPRRLLKLAAVDESRRLDALTGVIIAMLGQWAPRDPAKQTGPQGARSLQRSNNLDSLAAIFNAWLC